MTNKAVRAIIRWQIDHAKNQAAIYTLWMGYGALFTDSERRRMDYKVEQLSK